jgi:ferredoxin-NADP reductase
VTAGELTPPDGLAWKAVSAAISGYEKLSGLSAGRRPTVTEVNREITVIVDAISAEADTVAGFRLVAADRSPLPAWQPGAHLDVIMPSGQVRQYSLTGDPRDTGAYRIAVRRIADGGGGSIEMHSLRQGSVLRIRGPRNAFPFIPVAKYLFVAGGIGITPIRPMLHDAIERGADWALVYTGRTRESMAFAEELAGLDRDRVHIWPDDVYGVPDGRKILDVAPVGAALYCCGPPPMIEAIRRVVPAEEIATLHFERFSAAPVVGGHEFEIELARSGRVITVGEAETALAALRRTLPSVAYSCQQGFCGTCPVTVRSGAVEHLDRCLTDAQRQTTMAVCVSRATGRLVLDL